MSISPKERLKRLEKLLEDKEAEKKALEKKEKETEKELERTKKELASELAELRRDEEIQELQGRIEALEREGRTDDVMVSELESKGFDVTRIRQAMRLHLHDHPGHEHEPQSLEDIASEAPSAKGGAPVVYGSGAARELQDQVRGAQSFYDLASRESYDRLRQLEDSVVSRGGVMTSSEYQAIQQFHTELTTRADGYNDSAAYARRESAVIERIKEMQGLKIVSAYGRQGLDQDPDF